MMFPVAPLQPEPFNRSQDPSRHRTLSRRNPQAGYLLMECVIYVGALIVVLGIGFLAFCRSLDSSISLSRSTDEILRVLRAGERWRDEVRRGSEMPRTVSAGEATSVTIPQKDGSTIFYTFWKGAVWRKSCVEAPWKVVLASVKSSDMQPHRGRRITGWSWDIELTRPKHRLMLPRPMFHFLAVPDSSSAALRSDPEPRSGDWIQTASAMPTSNLP